jgi:hypothetical protein
MKGKLVRGVIVILLLWVPGLRSSSAAEVEPRPSRCNYYVVGPRALAHAIPILQADLDHTVTYEDPSWENAAGTMELYPGRTIPATKAVSFELRTGVTAKQVVQELIDAYSQWCMRFMKGKRVRGR